jgi:hypothetical protein
VRQGELFGDDRPLVVFRVRPEGRIEARWPSLDLCATFQDWPVALDMALFAIAEKLQLPEVSVRVRK